MKFSKEKLKEILVKPGYISEKRFNSAVKEAQEEEEEIVDFLVNKGLIKDEQLGFLIANEIDYPFVDLKTKNISPELIEIIPESVAKNKEAVVFAKDEEGLHAATTNPGDYQFKKVLEKKTGENVKYYYATSIGVREVFKFYKKGLKKEINEILKKEVGKVEQGEKQAPIIRIVNTLLNYAYLNEVSDIHIEPLDEKIRIRYRIDGVLHKVATLPKKLQDLVVTRIKIMAKLRTDQHFAAQDGKFTVKRKEESKKNFDVRVSIVPVSEGEKVVMRLLSKKGRRFDLSSLGFTEEDMEKVKDASDDPYGMILATGPTGSGKTTTLYSLLKRLQNSGINISTIEEPIEYSIEGVNQIQVNRETNLSFANGLRAIVRQDPDIIMVGEIRDRETAGIAVNSAMTGHLVLSTMHANRAATNLVRLVDMGVEPFLITSSVNVIIAQRLVRKICGNCRHSKEVDREEFKNFGFTEDEIEKQFGKKEKIRVYEGAGCNECNGTGYKGRVGVFEVLEMDEKIKKLVLNQAGSDEIEKQAIKNGMTTMIQDGLRKISQGITTIEEVARTTKIQ